MRRYIYTNIIIMALGLLIASCAPMQHPVIGQRTPSLEKAQRIEFTQTIYDFGIAGQGENIVYDFPFTNTGKEVLEIQGIDTDCGCTVAEPSSRKFQPGEGGHISATFQTARYNGPQEKKIIVSTNDPDNPKVELLITGRITKDIGLQPEAVSFGEVSDIEDISRKVKVFQIGTEDLKILGIDTSSNYLHVEKSLFKEQNNRGYELVISLDPATPPGELKEVITLHTNLKRRSYIDIPVYGEILGDIRVSPRTLSIGKIKKGERALERIRIFHTDNENFSIKEIACDLSYIEPFFIPASKANEFFVGIKITEDAPAGRLFTQISILTDSLNVPELKVAVTGVIEN